MVDTQNKSKYFFHELISTFERKSDDGMFNTANAFIKHEQALDARTTDHVLLNNFL